METTRSSKFAFAPLMPIAKVGFPLTMTSANDYRQYRADPSSVDVGSAPPGFSAAELRHNFAIKALQKPRLFKPRPYVYICLRCKYTFLANERRGSIVALDRNAQPIPEPENSRRLATFAQGPCPAFKSPTQRRSRETIELPTRRRQSPSGILRIVALIGARARYPYFAESHVDPPAGIVPQDMLF
jgi:hypothetical protein